jgi:hypothetical protein
MLLRMTAGANYQESEGQAMAQTSILVFDPVTRSDGEKRRRRITRNVFADAEAAKNSSA